MSDRRKIPDKALFVVNSLSGGGAERVCVYLANAMSRFAVVDIAVLYDDDPVAWRWPKATIASPGFLRASA